MFAVIYKPDASFQPKAVRDAVSPLGITVVRFHVAARGEVQEEDGKKYLLAGKNRFLIPNPPEVPAGARIGVMAVVNDSETPYELKIDDFKALDE